MAIDKETEEWIKVLDTGQTPDNLFIDFINCMLEDGWSYEASLAAWKKYWETHDDN